MDEPWSDESDSAADARQSASDELEPALAPVPHPLEEDTERVSHPTPVTVTRTRRALSALRRTARAHIGAFAVVAVLGAGATGYCAEVTFTGEEAVKDSVVQVLCGGEIRGAGFFAQIPGHEKESLVVTVRSAVECGERVAVVRWMKENDRSYPVTYSYVDVAATDATAGLAILRVRYVPKNMPAIPIGIAVYGPAIAYDPPQSESKDEQQPINPVTLDLSKSTDRDFIDPVHNERGDAPRPPLRKGAVRGLLTPTLSIAHPGDPVVEYTVLGAPLRGRVVGVVPDPSDVAGRAEVTDLADLLLKSNTSLLRQLDEIKVDESVVQERIRQIVRDYLHKDKDATAFDAFVDHVHISDYSPIRGMSHQIGQALLGNSLMTLDQQITLIEVTKGDFAGLRDDSTKDGLVKCLGREAANQEICETDLRRSFAREMMRSLFRYNDRLKPEDYSVTNVDVKDQKALVYHATVHVTDGAQVAKIVVPIKQAQGKLWLTLFDGEEPSATSVGLGTSVDISGTWSEATSEDVQVVSFPVAENLTLEAMQKLAKKGGKDKADESTAVARMNAHVMRRHTWLKLTQHPQGEVKGQLVTTLSGLPGCPDWEVSQPLMGKVAHGRGTLVIGPWPMVGVGKCITGPLLYTEMTPHGIVGFTVLRTSGANQAVLMKQNGSIAYGRAK